MKVEIRGVPKKFDDVLPGDFFRILDTVGTEFGICVALGEQERGAIIFCDNGTYNLCQEKAKLPRYVIHYPQATLRVASNSFGTEDTVGAVISTADGNSYFRVKVDGQANYSTFNLCSGCSPLDQKAPHKVFYQTWKIGHIIEDRFEELLSWPPSKTA